MALSCHNARATGVSPVYGGLAMPLRLLARLHPHTRGRLAEALALLPYLAKGYRPVSSQGCPVQVDLLLRRGHTLILVEVKYRASGLHRPLALHPSQRGRLMRAALWLSRRYPGHRLRADVVLVGPAWPPLRRVDNAFPLA